MIDGIIKADGTSRLMRAELPATYEEFRAQCHAGTQPLDVLFNALGWRQLPTFLNKANLLKDPTAALFGLGTNAVPDDVLGVLSRFQSGLGNEYVWEKLDMTLAYKEVQTLYQNGQSLAIIDGSNATTPTYTFQYADNIGFDSSGNVVLVSPTTFTANYSTFSKSYMNTLIGKYFTTSNSIHVGKIFFAPTTSTASLANSRQVFISRAYVVTSAYDHSAALVCYVNSPDPSAYPIDDGYTYNALGQLGRNVQIATGSYTGTGTYGSGNPNSLTFDFAPKFLVVAVEGQETSTDAGSFYWVGGSSGAVLMTDGNYQAAPKVSVNSSTVSWYSATNSKDQMNNSESVYHYFAIG